MRMQIRFLREGARTPGRATDLAAGYDLYACLDEPVTIPPGGTVGVGTGFAAALPEGWFAGIFARSGLAVKQGLRPANCVGVCDADYRGEYIVPLYNDSGEPRTVENGERIAQMVLLPCRTLTFELSGELGDTDRGAAGFGSTGK
ncbi:MAG: dUTP diphosphatase [Oscillospiraceae bacterium]|nr:dUTP diphosphatase [Oscillospiraceae bacterium]